MLDLNHSTPYSTEDEFIFWIVTFNNAAKSSIELRGWEPLSNFKQHVVHAFSLSQEQAQNLSIWTASGRILQYDGRSLLDNGALIGEEIYVTLEHQPQAYPQPQHHRPQSSMTERKYVQPAPIPDFEVYSNHPERGAAASGGHPEPRMPNTGAF